VTDLDELLGAKEIQPGAKPLRLVIGGPPGIGKTWLAATAEHVPELSPAFILFREGGVDGIDSLPEPRPRYADCESWDQLFKAFWHFAESLKKGECPYKTVILDTYSEAAAEQILAEGRKRAGITNVWDNKEFTISQAEYVNVNRKMRMLTKNLFSLPINVIVTCHTKTEDITAGDRVVGQREVFAVSEGSREPLERLSSVAGFMRFRKVKVGEDEKGVAINEDKRCFCTIPNKSYYAKARGSAANIGDMVDPTMQKIMDAILGRENAD
jgi:hypothetical protein